MTKKSSAIDPAQMLLDFTSQIDEYVEVKSDLWHAAAEPAACPWVEDEMEACIEIASAIKRTARESGLSREQLVDGINVYFGRSDEAAEADPPTCRKPLTIHMLNNYLSKPTEYPIPAYYLYAIHHVTGIIEPGATIIAAAGGQVATAEEVRLLQIGKLEQTMDELRRLRKDMRGRTKR